MTLFNTLASDTLSQQLPQGPSFPGTVTNGFPSVTSVLQHLVFKMSFQDVPFIAPSPSLGGDKKVILIFQRSPADDSSGLCTAYSLQNPTALDQVGLEQEVPLCPPAQLS